MSTSIFAAGVPTEPDVKALFDRFGTPAEGTLISYADVEALIRCPVNSARFKTVTHRWRREMEDDHHIYLAAERGLGFRALNPTERTRTAKGKFRSGMRLTVRAGEIAINTDATRLAPDDSRVRDHIIRTAATIRLTEKTAAKALRLNARMLAPKP